MAKDQSMEPQGDREPMIDADDLTPGELEALKKGSEEYKRAQKQLTDALTVMWNTRLDVAIASGKADRVERALGRPPVGLWDDCDCNQKQCGVGPATLGGSISQPGPNV